MKDVMKTIRKNWFLISIYSILLLGFFLRVYNLPQRTGFGSDSVRDVIIAQEALKRHELPLIGSFASAGPFVFGPLYFWFNMLALLLMPFSFKTPWILMNIVGLITVAVMMVAGYRIGGRKLCLIVGLFTACGPQFVSRSTGLTQHSLVGITSALLLLFFILFYQTKKMRYAGLMGISMGAALSMHYQAINLLIFLPLIFFIPKLTMKKKIVSFLFMAVGILLPSLPLVYWDSRQNFANYKNVLDYIFIAQYRIYVANSWRLYVIGYLPDYWSNVVGGNKPVATIVMAVTFFTFLYASIKRRIPGEIFMLGIVFGILLTVIRYYRGERFDGYMIYIAPFIFLLSGWALLTLYEILKGQPFFKKKRAQKILFGGSLLFFAVIILSDLKNASQFVLTQSNQEKQVVTAEQILIKKYPDKKFQLYDYYWQTSDFSYLLGEYLMEDNKISQTGVPIGVVFREFPLSSSSLLPIFGNPTWEVLPLTTFPKSQLHKPEWVPVNPPDVYNDLMKWQKTEKLKSTFEPVRFLKEKLHLR